MGCLVVDKNIQSFRRHSLQTSHCYWCTFIILKTTHDSASAYLIGSLCVGVGKRGPSVHKLQVLNMQLLSNLEIQFYTIQSKHNLRMYSIVFTSLVKCEVNIINDIFALTLCNMVGDALQDIGWHFLHKRGRK